MKTVRSVVVLFVACLLISVESYARYDHFSSIYNKYKEKDAIFALTFSPSSFCSFIKSDDKDLERLLKSISNIRMLSNDNAEASRTFKDDLKGYFATERYEDMMTINDGGDHVDIKALKESGKISEVVIVISDKTSLTVICLSGEVDVNGAKRIAMQFTKKKNDKS